MQYVFFDVEASKLFDFTLPADAPGQPRAAQIGMVFVDENRQITSRHEWLIKPRGWMMSPEATEITGLTTAHLEEHGGQIDEALDLYVRAIEARKIIAGWNTTYDLKVMRAELRHAGREDLFMKTRSMDLMRSARPIVKALDKNGRVKAPRLEEACAHFEIYQPKKHSALADAMNAFDIWGRLIDLKIVPEIIDPYNKKPKRPARKGKQNVRQEETDGDEITEEAALEIPE
jgi:DNA polymerase III epsilon subunit-like protein